MYGFLTALVGMYPQISALKSEWVHWLSGYFTLFDSALTLLCAATFYRGNLKRIAIDSVIWVCQFNWFSLLTKLQ